MFIRKSLYSVASSARIYCNHYCSSSGGGRRVIDRAARDGELRVFLVAGEVSGDCIASRLMNSLKKLSPLPVRFGGVGGTLMCKEGLVSIFPMEDISVIGIWELLPHLNRFRIKLKETMESAMSFRPHVIVTVDAKGFCFRLLKRLKARYNKKEENPVHIHYVAPSFWAWKGGESRLHDLSNFVDHLLCILPFEENICRMNGLTATFVGYSILEDILHLHGVLDPAANKWEVLANSECFRSEHGISCEVPVITLLPGSRLQEVKLMLPVFLEAVESLKGSFPHLTAVIPVAPNRDVQAYIPRETKRWSISSILIPGASLKEKYDAFSASTAAMCTSGSAVMELLLARLPCVVAYRAHFLTEWAIRYKANSRFISLPNILLDSAVIPEFLFGACTYKNLATALSNMMTDDNAREEQIAAAPKILPLLWHKNESINRLTPWEFSSSSDSLFPSMIAALTVIHSKGGQ